MTQKALSTFIFVKILENHQFFPSLHSYVLLYVFMSVDSLQFVKCSINKCEKSLRGIKAEFSSKTLL